MANEGTEPSLRRALGAAERFSDWLAVGLVLYSLYGCGHSRLRWA